MSKPAKTPEAKRRQVEAGKKNLADWKVAHAGESNLRHGVFDALSAGNVPAEIKAKIDAFQRQLENDLGGASSITAAEAALVASCRVSFSVVLLAQALLERSHTSTKRARYLSSVLYVVGNHQSNLARDLKILGLRRRRPSEKDSLQDIIAEYDGKAGPQDGARQ